MNNNWNRLPNSQGQSVPRPAQGLRGLRDMFNYRMDPTQEYLDDEANLSILRYGRASERPDWEEILKQYHLLQMRKQQNLLNQGPPHRQWY